MATHDLSATTIQSALERKRNEDEVIALSSLEGERVLAMLRLFIFMAWGLASVIGVKIEGSIPDMDGWRGALIGIYWFMSISALVSLRRVFRRIKAGEMPVSVRAGYIWPFVSSTIDYAMVLGMNWRDSATGHYTPDKALAPLALFLLFSVTRPSWWHTAYATLLSVVVFAISQTIGHRFTPMAMLFSSVTLVACGIVIGWLQHKIRRMFVDIRRRENLSRFLPRQIANRVLNNGDMLRPAQREVTIVFTDIRDFTSISETMAPGAVMAFLDRYFGHMSQIVKAHDGVVNKFLGDGMLAVWGVPDKDEHHPEKALKAALDMRKKLREFNDERRNENLPPIRMGIGVHTGVVAAGMLGGADQHEYTVIGDAVNLASRIEGLTKNLGTDLLVSESTWGKLHSRYRGERAGEEHVKGRREPVVVYKVEGSEAAASESPGAAGKTASA